MSLPRVKIPLRLDRDRTIILSFNALCRAEEVTGVNFLMGEVTFSSVRIMRALVWAGLLHEDPILTLEQVGDMIEEAGADKISGLIISAYVAAMPEVKDDGEEGDDDDVDPQEKEET